MATETNLAGLDFFAQALRQMPVAANKAAEVALNKGAEKALALGTSQILKELNLEKAYVQKHLTINKKAKRHDLLARIGAKRRYVLAPRYGAAVKTVANKTRRKHHKGDPMRGIPKGRKAAGSTPWSVKRGSPGVAWENAFFFYGRTSGAWIMAVRKGAGRKPTAINSPSVNQAWKSVRNDVTPAAMKVVEEIFLKEFKRLI